MINHRTRECKLIFFDYVKVQARMGVHNFAHPPCKKIRQESVGQKLKKITTLQIWKNVTFSHDAIV
jgi:hypothetical protein